MFVEIGYYHVAAAVVVAGSVVVVAGAVVHNRPRLASVAGTSSRHNSLGSERSAGSPHEGASFAAPGDVAAAAVVAVALGVVANAAQP